MTDLVNQVGRTAPIPTLAPPPGPTSVAGSPEPGTATPGFVIRAGTEIVKDTPKMLRRTSECSDFGGLRSKTCPCDLSEAERSEGVLHRCPETQDLRILESLNVDICYDIPEAEKSVTEFTPPPLTRQRTKMIISSLTKCRTVLDFNQFQEYVLFHHAIRNNLLRNEEDVIPEDSVFDEAEEKDSPAGILIVSANEVLGHKFGDQLWAPEDFELYHLGSDVDEFKRTIDNSKASIGAFIVEIPSEFLKDLDKAQRDKLFTGPDLESLKHQVKCWELFEKRFRDRAFFVLVRNNELKALQDVYHHLPSSCIPTYESGHIVVWSEEQVKKVRGFEWSRHAAIAVDEMPVSWPDSMFCSATRWKQLVFEAQLRELIRVARENYLKVRGSISPPGSLDRPKLERQSSLSTLIRQAVSKIGSAMSDPTPRTEEGAKTEDRTSCTIS